MWRWFVVFLFLGGAAMAQQGDCPDCGDPARPWRRGSTEISCAHPRIVAALRKQHPDKRIDQCGHCNHVCDIDAEQQISRETTGRYPWDHLCEARCKAVNAIPGCACPSPCEVDPWEGRP